MPRIFRNAPKYSANGMKIVEVAQIKYVKIIPIKVVVKEYSNVIGKIINASKSSSINR